MCVVGGRTDSRKTRQVHTSLHTNVYACVHMSAQKTLDSHGGSGPTQKDLQEIQMLPRVTASQRACRERKQSSGGH